MRRNEHGFLFFKRSLDNVLELLHVFLYDFPISLELEGSVRKKDIDLIRQDESRYGAVSSGGLKNCTATEGVTQFIP